MWKPSHPKNKKETSHHLFSLGCQETVRLDLAIHLWRQDHAREPHMPHWSCAPTACCRWWRPVCSVRPRRRTPFFWIGTRAISGRCWSTFAMGRDGCRTCSHIRLPSHFAGSCSSSRCGIRAIAFPAVQHSSWRMGGSLEVTSSSGSQRHIFVLYMFFSMIIPCKMFSANTFVLPTRRCAFWWQRVIVPLLPSSCRLKKPGCPCSNLISDFLDRVFCPKKCIFIFWV